MRHKIQNFETLDCAWVHPAHPYARLCFLYDSDNKRWIC